MELSYMACSSRQAGVVQHCSTTRSDMGWEERKGRLYYYRKRRVGEQVVSQYVGTGPGAEACAAFDRAARETRKRQRQKLRKEREALDEEARQVRGVIDQIRTLTHATLVAAGYHTHKGQWRKCRESTGS